MLRRFLLLVVACFLAGLGLAGCGKPETPSSPSSQTAPAEPRDTAMQPTPPAPVPESATLSAPQQSLEVAPAAQSNVTEAAAKLSQEADSLLSSARKLLAKKKVRDASGLLSKLSGAALSADQKQTLSGLKTELSQTLGDIDKGLGELKGLIAEKKYAEATAKVLKLKDCQLSPTQQSVYDGLKVQLQKALGNQATEETKKAIGAEATEEAKKALGGLLPGN